MQNSLIPKAVAEFNNSSEPYSYSISVVGERHHECRATRLVGDSTRFLFLGFSEGAKDHQILRCLNDLVESKSTIKWKDHNHQYASHYGTHSRLSIRAHRYTFFGYTESSMKSGQVILFREDSEWTVESLRSRLGNVFEVFVKSGAGKYAARLGLAFSATTESIDVRSRLI
jgi:RNA-dependent RNA polymerase